MFGETALESGQKEEQLPRIVTSIEALDQQLGGGIPLGKVTEIAGPPGVGRTQLCFQLCANCHTPVDLDGIGADSLLIDTEGTFSPTRMAEIASALCLHLTGQPSGAIRDSILSGTHVMTTRDYVELMVLVNALPTFLDKPELNRVKLIVIDSIAFPFQITCVQPPSRQQQQQQREQQQQQQQKMKVTEDDFPRLTTATRTRLICSLSQSLSTLAFTRGIAIVLTNQIASTSPVPALGEAWGHACAVRLKCLYRQNTRFLTVDKAPNPHPSTFIPYSIEPTGVRSAQLI